MCLFSLCNCDSLRAKTASLSLVHFLAQRIVPNKNVSWKKEQMKSGEDLQGHAAGDSGAGKRSRACVIPRPMSPMQPTGACSPGQSSQQEAQPFSRGGLFLFLKKHTNGLPRKEKFCWFSFYLSMMTPFNSNCSELPPLSLGSVAIKNMYARFI